MTISCVEHKRRHLEKSLSSFVSIQRNRAQCCLVTTFYSKRNLLCSEEESHAGFNDIKAKKKIGDEFFCINMIW